MNILGWWLASWIILAILSVVWISTKPSYETPAMERVRGYGTKAGFLPCFTFSILFFVISGIIYFVMKSRLDASQASISLPTSFAGGSTSPGPSTSPAANPFASPGPSSDSAPGADSTQPADHDGDGPQTGRSGNPFL